MILIQSASFLLLTKWTFVTRRKQKKKGAISSNDNVFTSSSNALNVKASCKFAIVQPKNNDEKTTLRKIGGKMPSQEQL
jgi:hypothetical protein